MLASDPPPDEDARSRARLSTRLSGRSVALVGADGGDLTRPDTRDATPKHRLADAASHVLSNIGRRPSAIDVLLNLKHKDLLESVKAQQPGQAAESGLTRRGSVSGIFAVSPLARRSSAGSASVARGQSFRAYMQRQGIDDDDDDEAASPESALVRAEIGAGALVEVGTARAWDIRIKRLEDKEAKVDAEMKKWGGSAPAPRELELLRRLLRIRGDTLAAVRERQEETATQYRSYIKDLRAQVQVQAAEVARLRAELVAMHSMQDRTAADPDERAALDAIVDREVAQTAEAMREGQTDASTLSVLDDNSPLMSQRSGLPSKPEVRRYLAARRLVVGLDKQLKEHAERNRKFHLWAVSLGPVVRGVADSLRYLRMSVSGLLQLVSGSFERIILDVRGLAPYMCTHSEAALKKEQHPARQRDSLSVHGSFRRNTSLRLSPRSGADAGTCPQCGRSRRSDSGVPRLPSSSSLSNLAVRRGRRRQDVGVESDAGSESAFSSAGGTPRLLNGLRTPAPASPSNVSAEPPSQRRRARRAQTLKAEAPARKQPSGTRSRRSLAPRTGVQSKSASSRDSPERSDSVGFDLPGGVWVSERVGSSPMPEPEDVAPVAPPLEITAPVRVDAADAGAVGDEKSGDGAVPPGEVAASGHPAPERAADPAAAQPAPVEARAVATAEEARDRAADKRRSVAGRRGAPVKSRDAAASGRAEPPARKPSRAAKRAAAEPGPAERAEVMPALDVDGAAPAQEGTAVVHDAAPVQGGAAGGTDGATVQDGAAETQPQRELEATPPDEGALVAPAEGAAQQDPPWQQGPATTGAEAVAAAEQQGTAAADLQRMQEQLLADLARMAEAQRAPPPVPLESLMPARTGPAGPVLEPKPAAAPDGMRSCAPRPTPKAPRPRPSSGVTSPDRSRPWLHLHPAELMPSIHVTSLASPAALAPRSDVSATDIPSVSGGRTVVVSAADDPDPHNHRWALVPRSQPQEGDTAKAPSRRPQTTQEDVDSWGWLCVVSSVARGGGAEEEEEAAREPPRRAPASAGHSRMLLASTEQPDSAVVCAASIPTAASELTLGFVPAESEGGIVPVGDRTVPDCAPPHQPVLALPPPFEVSEEQLLRLRIGHLRKPQTVAGHVHKGLTTALPSQRLPHRSGFGTTVTARPATARVAASDLPPRWAAESARFTSESSVPAIPHPPARPLDVLPDSRSVDETWQGRGARLAFAKRHRTHIMRSLNPGSG